MSGVVTLTSREYGELKYSYMMGEKPIRIVSFFRGATISEPIRITSSLRPSVRFVTITTSNAICPRIGNSYYLYDTVEQGYLEWRIGEVPFVSDISRYTCNTCVCNSGGITYSKERFTICPGYPCFTIQAGIPKTRWRVTNFQNEVNGAIIFVSLEKDSNITPMTLVATGSFECNCFRECNTRETRCNNELGNCIPLPVDDDDDDEEPPPYRPVAPNERTALFVLLSLLLLIVGVILVIYGIIIFVRGRKSESPGK